MIDILIPTFNRAARLRRCLEALALHRDEHEKIGWDTFDRHPLFTSSLLSLLAGPREVIADHARHAACLASASPRRVGSALRWALLLALADRGGRRLLQTLARLRPHWSGGSSDHNRHAAAAQRLANRRL